MGIIPSEYEIDENRKLWQAIIDRMNERRITPAHLALRTGYSRDRIERGKNGEYQTPTSDFLHTCVNAVSYGLPSSIRGD